jgi:hypothetical protein
MESVHVERFTGYEERHLLKCLGVQSGRHLITYQRKVKTPVQFCQHGIISQKVLLFIPNILFNSANAI